MTTEKKIIKPKVGRLELAKQLGNALHREAVSFNSVYVAYALRSCVSSFILRRARA